MGNQVKQRSVSTEEWRQIPFGEVVVAKGEKAHELTLVGYGRINIVVTEGDKAKGIKHVSPLVCLRKSGDELVDELSNWSYDEYLKLGDLLRSTASQLKRIVFGELISEQPKMFFELAVRRQKIRRVR